MKKALICTIVISFAISSTSLHAHQAKKQAHQKSREVALIKAIGGIGLAGFSGFYSFSAIGMMLFERKHGRKISPAGPTVLTIFLPLSIVGYQLAKSGLKDLDEMAQKD